jgi:hypothetical protein
MNAQYRSPLHLGDSQHAKSWYTNYSTNPLRYPEQIMFADMQITADGRFLEFNMGDWSMLVGGFMLVGLLVWLI